MRSSCVRTIYIVLFFIASSFFSGCTDSAKSKEQKQAHKAVQQALQEFAKNGDMQQVQSILRSVPSQGSGPAIDLIRANVSLTQANEFCAKLPSIEKNSHESLAEIKTLATRINELMLKKDQTADALQQRKTMIEMIQNGSEDALGLKGMQDIKIEREASKKEIEDQIAKLNEQANQAKAEADSIQAKANEVFEKARTTTDLAQQAQLEQQANEILAGDSNSTGKSFYMSQYQTALDQVASLDSSHEIISIELENLNSEIAQTEKKIQDYKDADVQLNLEQSITSMTSEIAQLSGGMESKLSGLGEIIAEYKRTSDEAVQTIDAAVSTFNRIPRDNADIQQITKLLQADALSTKAALLANQSAFYAMLSESLTAIAASADKSFSSPLLTGSEDYKAAAVKIIQEAFDGFDLADKEYEGLNFKPNNCPVIRNRLLNLFGKAKLANLFEKTEVYAAAVESAKTIVAEATDCTEELQNSYITKTLDSLK